MYVYLCLKFPVGIFGVRAVRICGIWCRSGRMEARDKKKVKLEFHATSHKKGMFMKKPEVPIGVRPTILKVKMNYINKFIGPRKEGIGIKVTSSQTKVIVELESSKSRAIGSSIGCFA